MLINFEDFKKKNVQTNISKVQREKKWPIVLHCERDCSSQMTILHFNILHKDELESFMKEYHLHIMLHLYLTIEPCNGGAFRSSRSPSSLDVLFGVVLRSFEKFFL